MQIRRYIPAPALRSFISELQLISSSAHRINRVLPHPGFALAIQLGGQVSLMDHEQLTCIPTMSISGVRKTFKLFNYEQETTVLIARFTKAGISGLLPKYSRELYNRTAPLDTYFARSELALLEEQLLPSSKTRACFKVLEAFLLTKMQSGRTDPLILKAIQMLEAQNGLLPIRELSRDLYISKDAFEKRFRQQTGATPKQMARIFQMQAAIRNIRLHSDTLSMAIHNGFYDQSHLNKAFKDFTGLSPIGFQKAAPFW